MLRRCFRPSHLLRSVASLALLSSVALAATWLTPGGPVAHAQCICPGEDTDIIGHRGTGTDADDNPFPENTVASFEQAVAEGATMVELDVQLSADGALVVMHDDTVDRTTDGSGCVADMTVSELQALSAGGEMVPTLEEVLGAVSVPLNVEIKVSGGGGCPPTDRDAVAAELARVLATAPDREVVVSSFDLDQLLALRAVDAGVPLAYLFTGIDGFSIAREQTMDAHPLALAARASEVRAHHEAGLAVRPYTVNDAPTMERMLDLGVDGIVTDEPDLLLETRAAFCDGYECPVSDAGAGGDAGMMATAGGDGGCAAAGPGTSGPGALALALALALLRARRRR